MDKGRTPKGIRTKRRIIDAAVGLINRNGVEKTTLVEVCSLAGVAQGTFYHYFKTIGDVLYEILRIEGEELSSILENLESGDPLDRLRGIIGFQLDYYEKKGKAVVAQILRNELTPNSGESRIEELIPTRILITRTLEDGVSSGRFSLSRSAEEHGIEIASLIFTWSFWWIIEDSDRTLRQMAGGHIEDMISEFVNAGYAESP